LQEQLALDWLPTGDCALVSHDEQDRAPASENLFSGHGTHSAGPLPGFFLCVPAAHGLHWLFFMKKPPLQMQSVADTLRKSDVESLGQLSQAALPGRTL